jgi:hypothetical protein
MLPETLLKDIISFAYSDTDEWQIAFTDFLESLEGNEPTEEEIDQFETDYIFTRKHSKYRKTFIRLLPWKKTLTAILKFWKSAKIH